jgi:citrate lyase beta subunit
VRINPLDTIDGLNDLLAFRSREVSADFLMLPKAQDTRDFQIIDAVLGHGFLQHRRMALWAVVETILGLKSAGDLAGWCGARGGILFGGADYSAAIGTGMDWEALFYARSRLVSEAKIVMGGLLDVPFLDVQDEAGLRAECERVKALGFLGKACIHPSQVATVNAVFSPSEAEIAWARRVMEANAAHQGSALLLDGKLLDTPVFLRAERILSQAGLEI